jgi:hypothetical protein
MQMEMTELQNDGPLKEALLERHLLTFFAGLSI